MNTNLRNQWGRGVSVKSRESQGSLKKQRMENSNTPITQ
jgi:hypothetical protein